MRYIEHAGHTMCDGIYVMRIHDLSGTRGDFDKGRRVGYHGRRAARHSLSSGHTEPFVKRRED